MRVETDAVTGKVVSVNGKRPAKKAKTRVKETGNTSVSGTNEFGVNGKVSRPNKRHMNKNTVTVLDVPVKKSYSSVGRRVTTALTYEQWKAVNGK